MKKNKKKVKELKEDYFLSISLFTPILLLLLKFFYSKNLSAIIVNFFLELSTFMLFYFLLIHLTRKISNEYLKNLFKTIFMFLFVVSTILFIGNSIFLDNALVMKYDFAKVDFNTVGFFLKDIMILKNYLITGVFLILSLVLGSINNSFRKITLFVKKQFLILFISLLIISSALAIVDYEDVANQYVITSVSRLSDFKTVNIKLNLSKPYNINQSYFREPIINYDKIAIPNNQKILVFVMEQTNYHDFLEAISEIPEEKNFFKQTKKHSLYFSNYYTQNQDSRTAVWDLLNSEFMPFESYLDNWNDYYGTTLNSNNLVDLFNSKSYKTVTTSSVYDSGLILGAYDWDELIFLKSFDENNKDFICLHEFEFQKGCEDKILLPQLKKFLLDNRNESYFFFQELIYGHGETFLRKVGESRTGYYNDYFLELYDFMKKNELLENVTFVIVSDHGDKGYFTKKPKHYNIPLVIINNKYFDEENDEFFTHKNFKDILLKSLRSQEIHSKENKTFLIGQTASNELGYINDKGEYFIGKLKNDDFNAKRIEGLSVDDIRIKVEELLAYRKLIINESLEENNYCVSCEANSKKVEEQRIN